MIHNHNKYRFQLLSAANFKQAGTSTLYANWVTHLVNWDNPFLIVDVLVGNGNIVELSRGQWFNDNTYNQALKTKQIEQLLPYLNETRFSKGEATLHTEQNIAIKAILIIEYINQND